jgi:hypothetical protein
MKMKKEILTALACILFSSIIVAQNAETTRANNRENNPSKRYLRPSLTILMINRGDAYSERMQPIFERYPVPDKYNDHNVNIRTIKINQLGGNVQEKQLSDFLVNNVSRDIVAKWFNRNQKGEFNMDLIAERGMYNATDADVIKAKSSERKTALLQDAGENLLDRSYILVFDIKKILSAEEYARSKHQPSTSEEGYYAWYDCYLYKLDWNDSIAAVFYNNLWNDASSFDPQRVKAFEQSVFPVKLVGKFSNAFGPISSTQNKDHSKNIFGSLSDEELFARLFPKIMDETETQLTQQVEDFRVKMPIYSTSPITAKIGLKEGLSVDRRYFVYEYQVTEKGEKKAVRKGVVRATNKITDNRTVSTGETQPSKFYQVAGRKLYQGMQLQEHPDWGFGITLGYGAISGAVGEGLSALLEINTSLYIGKVLHSYPTGIKVYGMVNMATSNFTLDINNNPDDPANPEFSVLSYSFGLSKDFNFLRNFVFVPFIGYGLETYTNTATDMDKDVYQSDYFEAGARLGINLRYNIQLMASFCINPISSTTYDSNNDLKTLSEEQMDLFKDQRNSGQLTIGLRWQF